MNLYKAKNVSSMGKKLEEDEGIPSIFLGGVNDHWVRKNGVVMAALLKERKPDTWIELGRSLISALDTSKGVGLAIDGTVSNEYREWLCTLGNYMGEGVVDIREDCRRNPVKPDRLTKSTTVLAIQDGMQVIWLSKVWDFASEPLEFNGCDLLLTFYEAYDFVRSIANNSLNMEQFLRTLAYANAWVIPIDENLGFIFGYTPEAPIEERIAMLFEI